MRRVQIFLVCWLIGCPIFVWLHVHAQDREPAVVQAMNAVVIGSLKDDTRELKTQMQGVISKVAVLEDNMFEVKWLGRSIAGVLLAQLGVTLRSTSTKRNRA